jgi:hypothetical protein
MAIKMVRKGWFQHGCNKEVVVSLHTTIVVEVEHAVKDDNYDVAHTFIGLIF